MGQKRHTTRAKGVPTSAGTRAHKFAGFFSRSNERKLRRIFRDHGRAAAEAWAEAHNARLMFLQMVKDTE